MLSGYGFEQEVEAALRYLERKFPDIVKVSSQPAFLEALRPHRADFELEYKLGGLTHQHLIECQNRNRSSHEIADKIYAVRGTSDRGRYIFVYKDSEYLSETVAKRLKEMGVLCFNFDDLKRVFLNQLEADIAIYKVGLAFVDMLKTKPACATGLGIQLNDEKHKEMLIGLKKHFGIAEQSFISPLNITPAPVFEADKVAFRNLLDSAAKYEPDRDGPVDRAMLSSS